MRLLTQAVGGLVLTVVGAAIALLLQSRGVIPSKPVEIRPLQVTGDPPVTVSDGSLHAHSDNDWMTNSAGGDKTLQPKTGQLRYTCLMADSNGQATSASLWADDKIYDILPGATITIVHDSADASSAAHAAEINITVPHVPPSSASDVLTITTVEGSFDAPKGKGGRNNREHSRRGEVESITISNPTGSQQIWQPVNYKNPHFTLEFCYK